MNLKNFAMALVSVSILGMGVANANEMLMGAVELHPGVETPIAMTNFACTPSTGPRVDSIQLRVYNGATHIDYFAVRYGDGQYEQFPVKDQFAPGSTSRVIALDGGYRCVQQVFLNGSGDGVRNAYVEVIGFSNIAFDGGTLVCTSENLRGKTFEARGKYEENVEQRALDKCYADHSKECYIQSCHY